MKIEYHSFLIEDAKKHGVESATILYNFRFWLAKNLANGRHIHSGRVWTYNSTAALAELFPYLSKDQIRRRIEKLEADGVLIAGNFNESTYNRTKWYSVDEEEFRVDETSGESAKSIRQNKQIHLANLPNRKGETAKSYNKETDINTDINTDIINPDPNFPEYEIPTVERVREELKEIGKIDEDDLEIEADNFFQYWEDQDWKKKNGLRVKDWRRQARTWSNNYLKFNRNKKSAFNSSGKLYSIKQANQLFLNNFAASNGTGSEFNHIFEHVSGEGPDMKFRLRDKYKPMIKKWEIAR